jgi:imidazoleglycerol-phosphate dehydratase
MPRAAKIERSTRETQIRLELNLDGSGQGSWKTGVGFFDHMLELFTRHGAFDLTVEAKGDLHVDQHHTVEDVGICLGQAVRQALGDKAGIRRYGHFTLPMEETLATTAIDLSGRYFLVFQAEFASPKIGDFDSELVEDFWQAFAANALCNLHVLVHYGRNSHHVAEAVFKSTARALRVRAQRPSRFGTLAESSPANNCRFDCRPTRSRTTEANTESQAIAGESTLDWELRIGTNRVFYDVELLPPEAERSEEGIVTIRAVGSKQHNKLFIRGREFEL